MEAVANMPMLLRWFDWKSACGGALLMSSLVLLINLDHGWEPALFAAGRQGLYTFFVAGLIVQFCRFLANRPLPRTVAVIVACLIPLILTVTMVYLMHFYRNTPEPLLSTLPVAILSFVAFLGVSLNETAPVKAEAEG